MRQLLYRLIFTPFLLIKKQNEILDAGREIAY